MKAFVPIVALSLLSIVSASCTTYNVYRQAETTPQAIEASEPATTPREVEAPTSALTTKVAEAPVPPTLPGLRAVPQEVGLPPPRVAASVPVPTELQSEIAHHESAHAVVTAGLLGPEKVLGVMVRTELGGGYQGDAGHVVSMYSPSQDTAATLRGRLAIFFAGRAMDIILHGEPMANARGDIAQANSVAWHLVVTSGVLAEETGSFMVLGGPEQASPELRARVAKELVRADATAKAFVKANEGLIRALAELVMAQEPKDGSRMLAPGQFQALLQDKKIVIPTKATRSVRRRAANGEKILEQRRVQQD